MEPLDTAYMVAGLPLAGLALRCWGRCARTRSAPWFVLGVVLGAVGVDGLRLLLRATADRPARWPFWAAAFLVGLFLALAARGEWRRFEPRPTT